MFNTSAYDKIRDITRDSNGRAITLEPVDCWWNADYFSDMPIYQIGDKLYCAYGWDGSEYIESFEVSDCFTAVGGNLTLQPVYRYEDEGIDLESVEDDDDLYNCACEIIGFVVN